MKAHTTFVSVAIALVQLFDLAIHAATDQLEPLRVASNLVILLWLAVVTSGKISASMRQTGIVSLGGYLLLNALFLAQAGFTNPAQGGAVRWMLILLVALTLALTSRFLHISVHALGGTISNEKRDADSRRNN